MFAELAGKKITVQEFAQFCGGYIARGKDEGRRVCSVCTDSRELAENCVFIAIRGTKVDGHSFLCAARDAGAAAAVVDYLPDIDTGDLPLILTDSSVNSLDKLARAYCADNRATRVAVTGSVGKTTTKEMISAALDAEGCFHTKGNFNSIIGMPVSFLSMPGDLPYGVFELGLIFGLGLEEKMQISRMSKLLKPEIAVITNVGSSHLEHMSGRDELIAEKLGVADGMPEGGKLLIDLSLMSEAEEKIREKKNVLPLTFSVRGEEKADYRAENIRENGAEQIFDAVCPTRTYKDVKIRLYGIHNVQAALIAVAVADICGIDETRFRAGIENYRPVSLRQEIIKAGGVTVINDCYNASPESMRAACSVLCGKSLGIQGKRAAILGDMFELGKDSERMHVETGRYFAEAGIDFLICFGEGAAKYAEGARGILPDDRILIFTDKTDYLRPAAEAAERLEAGDAILVKASRGMAAERVTAALTGLLKEKKGE